MAKRRKRIMLNLFEKLTVVGMGAERIISFEPVYRYPDLGIDDEEQEIKALRLMIFRVDEDGYNKVDDIMECENPDFLLKEVDEKFGMLVGVNLPEKKAREKSKRKTVYLPIEVPNNDFCWDGETPCPYFSNEGGYGCCDLKLGDIVHNDVCQYVKPPKCRDL